MSKQNASFIAISITKHTLKQTVLILGGLLVLLLIIFLIQKANNNREVQTVITKTVNTNQQTADSSNKKPCKNPNAQKVVFTEGGNIWSINVDGTCKKQLTTIGMNFDPQLSPTGNKIVYYSIDSKSQDQTAYSDSWSYKNVNIWVTNIDGSHRAQLTSSNLNAARNDVAWSSDGTKILYRENNTIVIENVDGSNKKTLINLENIQNIGAGLKAVGNTDGLSFVTPRWTPDGNNIALFSYTNSDIAKYDEGFPQSTQIVLFNLNGNEVARHQNALNGLVYWSKNNILYDQDSTNGIGGYGLETVNLDGSDRILIAGVSPDQLFPKTYSDQQTKSAIWGSLRLAFSKDGSKIAISRDWQDLHLLTPLWLMNVNGSDSRGIPLSIVSTNVLSPSLNTLEWFPDSKHIVFTTLETFTDSSSAMVGLYAVDSETGKLTILDAPHLTVWRYDQTIYDDQFSTGVNQQN